MCVGMCKDACIPSTCEMLSEKVSYWEWDELFSSCVVAHWTSPSRPSQLIPSLSIYPFCLPFFLLSPLPLTTLPLFSLNPFLTACSMFMLNFFCYVIFLQSFPLSPPYITYTIPLCILFSSLLPLHFSYTRFSPSLSLYSLLFLHSMVYFFVLLPLPPFFNWWIPPPPPFLALSVLSPSFPLSTTRSKSRVQFSLQNMSESNHSRKEKAQSDTRPNIKRGVPCL